MSDLPGAAEMLPWGLRFPLELLLVLVSLVALGWITGAIRYIRNSRVGVAEKLFSVRGSVPSGLIALGREAGYSPTCCAAGCTS